MKKEEVDDDFGDYSPETRMILHALPDTPESLELKREYLQKKNRLNRGHIVLFSEALFVWNQLLMSLSQAIGRSHGTQNVSINMSYHCFL